MDKNLPIFDIVLNDDDLKQGVGMISLVDDPAIGVNWIKLRNQLVDIEMSFTLTKDGICLGCPPTGDGKRKDGSPDKRCGDGVRKTSSKKPKKEEPKKESNNIPKDSTSYNDIPDSEWDKNIDKSSLPEPQNNTERFLNALVINPQSVYSELPKAKTLQDAISNFGFETGPNGNEYLAVQWAKKIKFL